MQGNSTESSQSNCVYQNQTKTLFVNYTSMQEKSVNKKVIMGLTDFAEKLDAEQMILALDSNILNLGLLFMITVSFLISILLYLSLSPPI